MSAFLQSDVFIIFKKLAELFFFFYQPVCVSLKLWHLFSIMFKEGAQAEYTSYLHLKFRHLTDSSKQSVSACVSRICLISDEINIKSNQIKLQGINLQWKLTWESWRDGFLRCMRSMWKAKPRRKAENHFLEIIFTHIFTVICKAFTI